MKRTIGWLAGLLASSVILAACGGGGGGSSNNNHGGSLTVTYDANGATSGSVPTDSSTYAAGNTVTVLGNPGGLAYTGYKLVGWQTKADGTGTVYTQGQTFAMGSAAVTLYALWAGGSAYAANSNHGGLGTISQYWIASNGALVPMPTPSVSTGGNNPQYLSVDPAGAYLYVSNVSSNNIGMLTIDQASGGIAAMSPATIASSTGPSPIYPFGSAVHPSGKWFYVVNNQQGTVSQFMVGTTGGLGSMVSTVLLTPETNQAVAPYAVAIVPSGKYAFVACQLGNSTAKGTIYQLAIDDTTGALSANGYVRTTDPYFGYTTPASLKIASVGSTDYVYVANYQKGTVWAYKVQSDGTLAYLGAVNTGALNVLGLAAHPSGKYLYAAIYTNSQSSIVAQFSINQADGTLSPMTTATVGGAGYGSARITIESSGKYAYVTSGDTGWGSTYVTQYTIDQVTGALTVMGNPSVLSQFGPVEIVTVGK
jgi:DNA-binding beta-propeller fold protein YncE